MKLTEGIHLVGSGRAGIGLSDDYDCHVWLVKAGDECALIDTGAGRDVPAILRAIEADGVDPARVRTILLTHAHADHAGGAAALRARLGARVCASREAARQVETADETATSLQAARAAGAYPEDYTLAPCPVDRVLAPGEVIRLGDATIAVVPASGHSSGHVAYLLASDAGVAAFTGDAVFSGGRVVLQRIWDCSVQESAATIERLAALRPDGLYPGHGLFHVRHGYRELDKAMEWVRRLLVPPQLSF